MVKNIIIATLVAGLGLYAYVHLTAAHNNHPQIVANPVVTTPVTHGNCPWWATDLNHDCNHNPADQGKLAAVVQLGNAGDVPTNTPTPTPTDTPTNTPVPTATNTPTSLFSLTELINDVSSGYPVQGSLCDPPASYNWGQEGHGLGFGAPQGTHITPWWTAQWNGCGDSASGVSIIFDNFHAYGWTGSTWIEFAGSYRAWCATTDPNTTSNYAACTPDSGTSCPTTDTSLAMPTDQRALHGGFCQTEDQNVQCVVVVYHAKSSGSKDIMANAGLDHWNNGTHLWDMFISRYKLLNTSTLTQVGGSSCTAATINANPPPGF